MTSRKKREQIHNLLLLILVIYLIYSGGRFWFYLREAKDLIEMETGTNYSINHGGGREHKDIFVVGDSVSVGVGAQDYTGSYHYQYLSKFTDTHQFTVKNYSMSGARVADLNTQFDQIEIGDRADVMFITIGGNDITHGTSWTKVEEGLRSALVRAHALADTVILITPGDLQDVRIVPYPVRRYWGARSPFYSELVADIVEDTGTIHVDIFALGEWIFGEAPEEFYADDLFHPSREGYRIWAEAIEQFYVFE